MQRQLNSCHLLHRCTKKSYLKRPRSSELSLLSRPCVILMVCSNNVSVLHRFQDITTFTLYMTDCLWPSWEVFTFDKTDEIKATCTSGFTCKFIHAFPKIWEAERFKTKVTFSRKGHSWSNLGQQDGLKPFLESCHCIWQINFSLSMAHRMKGE